MSNRFWTCVLALTLVMTASVRVVHCQDQFREALPHKFTGDWREQRESDLFHRKQRVVGGLGLEVCVGGWPRLLQRGFLDVADRSSGNRDVYGIAGWCDLGQVRLGSQNVKPKLAGRTWCYLKYSIDAGQTLTWIVSRLSPGTLFESQSGRIELFAGEKACGKGMTRKETHTRRVPQYVCFSSNGRAVVGKTSSPLSLKNMSESWLLFWYGNTSYFYRTKVPNILWGAKKLNECMRTDYFVPADLPVLVVFQKKPVRIEPTRDSLAASFQGGAGTLVVLPVLGFYHPPAKETEQWKDGVPADVVDRCRVWARRLKHFPLTCRETYRVKDHDSVTIQQQFTYLDLADEWGTKAERIAPVPPVVALAQAYGFSVKSSGDCAEHAIQTHSGPYSGIAGTDTASFTVRGLGPYVDQTARSNPPLGADAKVLARELKDEVTRMIDAGDLAPAMSLGKKHAGKMEFHFANPADTILALAEAIPYLDDPTVASATEHVRDVIQEMNPLKCLKAPNFGRARREYFDPVDADYFKKIVGYPRMAATTNISQEQRANSVYALWAFARAAGSDDMFKEPWDDIKSVALSVSRAADWATCGYFRPYGGNRGSIEAVQGQFARYIALARMAERFNDAETEQRAIYALARTACLFFSQGKIVPYMYDQKFQTVDADPNWMAELSMTTGDGGRGLLWTGHWAGAEDDVRQVIRWDEFGPVVAQMYGDMWFPVFTLFQDLTPEAGRFLGDHMLDECTRYVAAVERNAPHWFVTRRDPSFGTEVCSDSPRNSYGVFLGKAYALGTKGSDLMRNQDVPFCRVGDLYHIRRLVANLRAFGGQKYEAVR